MPSRADPSQPSRFDEWLSPRALAIDIAIAAALTGLSVLALMAGTTDLGPTAPINITLLFLQTVPLVFRRLFPLGVLVLVMGALILQIGVLPTGANLRSSLGPLVALYSAGELGPRRISFPLAVALAATIGILMISRTGLVAGIQPLIQTMTFMIAAWYLGDATRVRRLYTSSLEDQARLLQREREERERRAIQDERDRIARELHDSVTHHVSVVVIQAAGALRAIDSRPEEARTALRAIDATGRQALTEMRRMLGVLGEGEMQEPMPGLDRLGDLLEQVRAAGLKVELSMEGEPRRLDPGLELSAYRIIQEALTNSLKHAGGGRARVSVRYGKDSLDISIDDDRGPSTQPAVEPDHPGRGLVGMRERVAMFRGTFSASPTPTGFRVSAQLPLEEAVG
jgi:signal transduction histidine kinase